MPAPSTNSAIRRGLASDFIPSSKAADFLDVSSRMGAWANTLGIFGSAPAVRAFWPAYNRSYANPHLSSLSVAGSPPPEWIFTSFRGFTRFTAANDNAMTGTASLYNVEASHTWTDQEGLYLGAWVRFTTVPASEAGIISNWVGFGNKKSYRINRTSSNYINFSITIDGGNQFNVTTSGTVTTGVWYFVAGIFYPSTSIRVYLYDSSTGVTEVAENTTSIPASLYQPSPVAFALGRHTGISSGTDYRSLNGDMCLSFFCPVRVSEYWPHMMRQVSEPYVTGFSD